MDKHNIINGDCLKVLPSIQENSIDLVLTDPPYFIDGLDGNWQIEELSKKSSKAKVIQGLPVGMKFDVSQSKKLFSFLRKVNKETIRVLKPGGFMIMFSQARLYHSMAFSAEKSGFEIRDMIAWVYGSLTQPKAFSLNHFIDKSSLSEEEKTAMKLNLGTLKTPQLRPMIEPMVLAQKPRNGTFLENWQKWGVGLMESSATLADLGLGEFRRQLDYKGVWNNCEIVVYVFYHKSPTFVCPSKSR